MKRTDILVTEDMLVTEEELAAARARSAARHAHIRTLAGVKQTTTKRMKRAMITNATIDDSTRKEKQA